VSKLFNPIFPFGSKYFLYQLICKHLNLLIRSKQTTVYTHIYICSVHINFKHFRKKKWW